jgi:superfamily II DNA or RNA helicase
MTALYTHQQAILDENPPRAILNWEMRTGKSLPAALWIDLPSQAGNTYIITKKSNKKSWEAFNTKATVLTKEEFKKRVGSIVGPTAIVVDELHHFGSGLFTKSKKRSALAVALYTLLRKYPECHFLGLTGSPVRNSPWSFHTLLCYLGVFIDPKEWRKEFFDLKYPSDLAYLVRPSWIPKPNWREGVDKYVRKYTNVVALSDVVDVLPPVTSRVINIKQKPYKKPADEIVTWVHEHKHEQQGKVKEILELGYKKMILVCKYTSQIDEVAAELQAIGDRPVYVLDGRTKDQQGTIEAAQEAQECYLITQSAMCEGWDGWNFGAMVFCSMSHTYVENIQMHGRQRHPKYLRDIEIIYLIGGRWDQKILDAYNKAENFNPHSHAT